MSNRKHWRTIMQTWLVEQRWKADESFRVLDVGADDGSSGHAIKARFPKARIDAVDIWPAACRALAADRAYTSVTCCDALRFLLDLSPRYDVVLAAEIVEHLPKPDGLALLSEIRRTSDLAIVTSPLGFMEQGELGGNPYQRHLSGWTDEDMRGLGWTTFCLLVHEQLGVWYTGRLYR